jgi:hypothetical protein
MKLVAACFTLLFLFACYVQLNDPDPLTWIGLYGVAVVISATVVMGRPSLRLSAVAAGIYLVAVILWIEALPATSLDVFQHVDMSTIEEEEVRELWGMILCLAWSSCVWLHARRIRSVAENTDVES